MFLSPSAISFQRNISFESPLSSTRRRYKFVAASLCFLFFDLLVEHTNFFFIELFPHHFSLLQLSLYHLSSWSRIIFAHSSSLNFWSSIPVSKGANQLARHTRMIFECISKLISSFAGSALLSDGWHRYLSRHETRDSSSSIEKFCCLKNSMQSSSSWTSSLFL